MFVVQSSLSGQVKSFDLRVYVVGARTGDNILRRDVFKLK